MEELPCTIHGTKCLITGFGRVAKVLTKTLLALGADVTVCVRKYADMAWIKIYGAKAAHTSQLEQEAQKCELLVNTVPAMLFNEQILSGLRKDCLVIDLASKPGGVDFDTAQNLGVKAIWALSLPGKVAPVSSGGIICDTIINILRERGLAS